MVGAASGGTAALLAPRGREKGEEEVKREFASHVIATISHEKLHRRGDVASPAHSAAMSTGLTGAQHRSNRFHVQHPKNF